MPSGESLENFARSGATLAIHLSIHQLTKVVTELTPFYGEHCPVAIVYRASWPDQEITRSTLCRVAETLSDDIKRTALILVGPALAADDFAESSLYAKDYDRRFRPQSAESPFYGSAD